MAAPDRTALIAALVAVDPASRWHEAPALIANQIVREYRPPQVGSMAQFAMGRQQRAAEIAAVEADIRAALEADPRLTGTIAPPPSENPNAFL